MKNIDELIESLKTIEQKDKYEIMIDYEPSIEDFYGDYGKGIEFIQNQITITLIEKEKKERKYIIEGGIKKYEK